ncbi:MAG: cell wall-active antibiotics response protein [Actinobacteria bacterium]|nr:cell wall-active antibiotics response protein [Actinomycetota bacterium]
MFLVSNQDDGRLRLADAQVVGLVLLTGGVLWLLDVSGVFRLSFASLLSILLIVLGAAIMVSGAGPRAGAIVTGVVLILVLTGSSFFTSLSAVSSGPDRFVQIGPRPPEERLVGEAVFSPTRVEQLSRGYSFGVVDATMDLSDIDFPSGETPLAIQVGIGELTLIVPREIALTGRVQVGVGEIKLFARRVNAGIGVTASIDEPAETGGSDSVLVLAIKAGIGEVNVVRATF